jgi:hypothetical protein
MRPRQIRLGPDGRGRVGYGFSGQLPLDNPSVRPVGDGGASWRGRSASHNVRPGWPVEIELAGSWSMIHWLGRPGAWSNSASVLYI